MTKPPMANATLDKWFWLSPTFKRALKSRWRMRGTAVALSTVTALSSAGWAASEATGSPVVALLVNIDRNAWASSHFNAWIRSSRAGGAGRVDAKAAHSKDPLHQVLFHVHGLDSLGGMLIFSLTKTALVHVKCAVEAR